MLLAPSLTWLVSDAGGGVGGGGGRWMHCITCKTVVSHLKVNYLAYLLLPLNTINSDGVEEAAGGKVDEGVL